MDVMNGTDNNSGFTVIEAMIAIFLFGVVFLASNSMLMNSSRRTAVVTNSTLAVWKVAATVESFKNLCFTPANLATMPPQLTADGFMGDNVGGVLGDSYDRWRSNPRGLSADARTVELPDMPQGQLNWFVENDRSSSPARSARVGICISWIEPGGRTVCGEENVKMLFGTLVKTPGL